MIKLKCPHCNQLLQIPEQYAGQTGACKHCQQKLTVPELAGDLLVDASARPAAVRRRKWMPFAAGGAVAAILALGIFMFVSRDASPPAATSPEAPIARRIIEFPSDRVVGELHLRDIGEQWWGTRVGEARGPFLVPEGKELGVSVWGKHAPDLSFLRDLAADDLSFLMLEHAQIDDRQLENIEHLTGLKSMYVLFCGITDNGLRSFGGLAQLETLILGGRSITDEGLGQLAGLEGLKVLGLSRTKITHRGIRAIRSLQNIGGFHLSPAALTPQMVDALKEFPNLGYLSIVAGYAEGFVNDPSLQSDPDVPVNPESIMLLRDLPHLTALVFIGTLNDDSLIPALSQLSFLEGIVFNKTSVTPAGRNELRRALPNCTITPQDPLDLKSTEGPRSAIEAARQLAIEGKYREAVEAFEKFRRERPDAVEPRDGNHFGAVYAQLGKRAEHETLCRWLFNQFPLPQRPQDAERAAKAYILYPGVDDEELLEQAAMLTKYAVGNGTGGLLQWFNVSHGMAEYRLKRYREASRWLDKESGNNEPVIQSLALAYSAMAEYGRGNEKDAHEILIEARAAVAKLPQPGSEDYSRQWPNVLTSNLALGEAEKLIGSSKAASPPPPEKPTAPQVNSIQLLPADNLDAFTVSMRDHGIGKDPNSSFKLVDGVLVASGAEIGMLFTNEEYENYKLEVDYKWLSDRPDRDSGIFVNILGREGEEHKPGDKMRAIEVNILGPKVIQQNSLSGQIWLFSQQGDTVKLTVDGQVYTKNTAASAPPEDFENPIGEWNTMEITSAHGKFLVKLNGKVVVDATDPIPSRGKIVLQSSRGEIHFGRMILTPLE